MLNATLKSLLAHKLRVVLTTIAVIIGVSFVSGTFVLTDSIRNAFDDIFSEGATADVVVSSSRTLDTGDGGQQITPLDEEDVTRIRDVDGVRAAEGYVQGFAQIIGKDGDPAGQVNGPPTFGVSLVDDQDLNGGFTLRSGELPAGDGQVALDQVTVDDEGFALGDEVRVITQDGSSKVYELAGILGYGESDNLGGVTFAGFDLATAQQVMNREGKVDGVNLLAADGVSDEQLRDRVAAALGDDYDVQTAESVAAQQSQALQDGFVNILSTALLVFAAIALLVGSFVIFNTFSIIVAQRGREIALLRCIGASRAQILGSVLLEALVSGLVASAIGLGLGFAVAIGLQSLFTVIGAELPTAGLPLLPRTVVVSLIVGVVVTVLASVIPAVRATRVAPIAALRADTAPPRSRSLWLRGTLGVLIALAGAVLIAYGLLAEVDNRLLPAGSGAAAVLLGLLVLAPVLARPFVWLIGLPVTVLMSGRLARRNAMRNPRRTSATALALTVGLALVTCVGIFAASLQAGVDETLDRSLAADYQLSGSGFQGFSPEATSAVADLPEVRAISSARQGSWLLDGERRSLTAVDPVGYAEVIRQDLTAGSFADMEDGGLAVFRDTATAEGWEVGTVVPMEFLATGVQQVTVKAIYDDRTLNNNAEFLLSLRDYEANYTDQQDIGALVRVEGGPTDANRAAIETAIADFPGVEVQDKEEIKEQSAAGITQLLNVIFVLLGLSILVALFGIVNTLALSVFERVRELGLLRAVGMGKAQVRSMISWESVLIAVLGALVGLAVGVLFGWVLVRAVQAQPGGEFITFTLSLPQLGGFLAAAVLVGILAAIVPAIRAARVNMLRAITSE